mgnify:CR=1 FL=1
MKIKGFIKIALMVLIVIMIFSSIAYADNDNFSFSEINTQTAGEDIKNPVGAVMGAVRIIATGVAIVMISVVAMKYLMAAPGDRADMKKASIQYVVGAVLVFGAANILTILVNAFTNMVPEIE